jgi:hypothetical protein
VKRLLGILHMPTHRFLNFARAVSLLDLLGPLSGCKDPIRVYFSVSQQLPTEFAERQLAEGKTLRTGEGSELGLIRIKCGVRPRSHSPVLTVLRNIRALCISISGTT